MNVVTLLNWAISNKQNVGKLHLRACASTRYHKELLQSYQMETCWSNTDACSYRLICSANILATLFMLLLNNTVQCSAQILQINKPSSECMSLSWWEVEREVGMFCKASKLLLLQPPHIYPRFGVFEPFCRGPLQIVLIVQMQMQWINNKTGKSTPVWEE